MSKSENEAAHPHPHPHPHVAVFPSAGMGHLNPLLRLAAELNSRGCSITIITAEPTVSDAESDHLSNFFAIFPHIKRHQLHLVPHHIKSDDDPFFVQWARVGKSVHLLQPFLSSASPPLSAAIVDFPILGRFCDLASSLRLSIPTYTLIITSARFFSLMASLSHPPHQSDAHSVDVPGLGSIPLSSIPPPMLDPNHIFAAKITENTPSLQKLKGVLINTSTWLEPEAVEALRRNGVPHILPIGPLQPFETSSALTLSLPWLDEQAPGSVLYLCFGSRSALSKEQITELAAALEMSGCKFLWVLKGSKVDKEDNEQVEEMVGAAFLEKTKASGRVIKGFVEQEKVLAHPAIGGFVNHCGWNSVTEAAALGVPILAWPLGGDQRVTAEVVEKVGLGVWPRDWGWGGHRLIGRDEIADMFTVVMGDDKLRAKAKEVREKARQAREVDGSTERLLQGLIQSFKTN